MIGLALASPITQDGTEVFSYASAHPWAYFDTAGREPQEGARADREHARKERLRYHPYAPRPLMPILSHGSFRWGSTRLQVYSHRHQLKRGALHLDDLIVRCSQSHRKTLEVCFR